MPLKCRKKFLQGPLGHVDLLPRKGISTGMGRSTNRRKHKSIYPIYQERIDKLGHEILDVSYMNLFAHCAFPKTVIYTSTCRRCC